MKTTIAICLLALVIMAGCSDKNSVGHDTTLVGTWDLATATLNGYPVENKPVWRITLYADGTGASTVDDDLATLSWSTSGDKLTLSISNDPGIGSLVSTYSISGNTLTLTATDDNVTIVLTWTKQGT